MAGITLEDLQGLLAGVSLGILAQKSDLPIPVLFAVGMVGSFLLE